MIGTLLQADFEEIIGAKDWEGLRDALSELDPSDIAELIIDLPAENEGIIFRVLPREKAADVFEYLPRDKQRELLKSLSSATVKTILDEMNPDDRQRLFDTLPAEVTRQLLDTLSPEELKAARELLGYPKGTVGRYMTPEYVALPPDITAQEALDLIRRMGRGKETLNIVYLINEKGQLLEDLRLGSLVLADPEMMIGDIEDRPMVAVNASDSADNTVQLFEQYDRAALPVIDGDRHLLGIITHDDVLEFAEQRATEEIQKLGGTEALDKPYFTVTFWEMVKKRGGWLAILFLGEMLTATAMGYFESAIERAAVVALFVPLIISSGGNSGSQGTSIIIRALALKELRLRDWWRVFGRELRTGLALGIFLGAIGLLRITAWQGLSQVPVVGGFFQTHGAQDEQRIPDNMRMVTADVELKHDVNLPAFTLPAGAQINKGMLVPKETSLPDDVPSRLRSYARPTAYGQHWFLIGATVFVALIGVVTWGSLAGSMLPFMLRRIGFDPASASAPFVATLVDVTGLIIYFSVAMLILRGTLL
ncbi:MAG TPA: magnesium transporter [Tepidisphaeraceae bacterium]|nr:magnesium transporter [Tepidisphaeraceae bacterium]